MACGALATTILSVSMLLPFAHKASGERFAVGNPTQATAQCEIGRQGYAAHLKRVAISNASQYQKSKKTYEKLGTKNIRIPKQNTGFGIKNIRKLKENNFHVIHGIGRHAVHRKSKENTGFGIKT